MNKWKTEAFSLQEMVHTFRLMLEQVLWQENPLHGMATIHIGKLMQILAPPLLTQLPANVSGKAEEDVPSRWAPALTWETKEKLQVPGFSQAQPCPT